MAGETIITVVGNLTDDPELKTFPDGGVLANFAVASTPRYFDRQENAWKDGETMYYRCVARQDNAANACDSLTKGARVIVQGQYRNRKYTKDGENRYAQELHVDEIGPSLRFATADVKRSQGGGNSRPPAQSSPAPGSNGWADTGASGGSWATPDQQPAWR